MTSTVHRHAWHKREDWGGDSAVPGGTFDASVWVCEHCGEERDATGINSLHPPLSFDPTECPECHEHVDPSEELGGVYCPECGAQFEEE